MKKTALFLLLACCLCLAGCSKDSEVNAFITELDSTTNDMVKKIDANPNSAGIDEAQKAFDAKKADLKTKLDAFKDAANFQVTADTRKKLEDSIKNNFQALANVFTKNLMKMAADKDAQSKYQTLIKDYQNTLIQSLTSGK